MLKTELLTAKKAKRMTVWISFVKPAFPLSRVYDEGAFGCDCFIGWDQ